MSIKGQKTITAVIIDDEPKGRQVLKSLLAEFCPEVEVVGMADSVKTGAAEIKMHEPELVFLDIEMPGGNGFTLFDHFDEIDFEVVFTTAYDAYALRAIKVSALDYILKPIVVSDLREAVEKLKKQNNSRLRERVHLLEDDIRNTSPEVKHIALPTAEGYYIINTSDIFYVESDGSYSNFHLAGKEKIMVSKVLRDYEELLSGSGFFRIHNSYLVNLKHIRRYVKGKVGQVVLSDNSVLDVATRRKNEFLSQLNRL